MIQLGQQVQSFGLSLVNRPPATFWLVRSFLQPECWRSRGWKYCGPVSMSDDFSRRANSVVTLHCDISSGVDIAG